MREKWSKPGRSPPFPMRFHGNWWLRVDPPLRFHEAHDEASGASFGKSPAEGRRSTSLSRTPGEGFAVFFCPDQMAMGQNPNRSPSEHPQSSQVHPPMNQNGNIGFDNHSQISSVVKIALSDEISPRVPSPWLLWNSWGGSIQPLLWHSFSINGFLGINFAPVIG